MTPKEIVAYAEEVHRSRDVERMLSCFDPEIVAYWNGQKIAQGLDELRAFYKSFFDKLQDFTLTKTLRAATGDMIAVEWTHTKTDEHGNVYDGHAAEFWTMRGDRLVEWHAYCTEYPRIGR